MTESGSSANELANSFGLEVDSIDTEEEGRELLDKCVKDFVNNFYLNTPDEPKNLADYEAIKISAELLNEQLPKLYKKLSWSKEGLDSWNGELSKIIQRCENKINLLNQQPSDQRLKDAEMEKIIDQVREKLNKEKN